MLKKGKSPQLNFTGEDWSDLEACYDGYSKSKLLAEKAAWDWKEKNMPQLELVVMCPGLVTGPPLTSQAGTSADMVSM